MLTCLGLGDSLQAGESRVPNGPRILTGPDINEGSDSRFQAQDAFATAQVSWSGPAVQESFAPTNSRFGTVAFSRGSELTNNFLGPNLVTGDSITVIVQDLNGAGGIIDVSVYAMIVEGPHTGKAPPPHVVGGSGFFVVPGSPARNSLGVIVANHYFVDLDDDYFLPGDVLYYFWAATDASGAFRRILPE